VGGRRRRIYADEQPLAIYAPARQDVRFAAIGAGVHPSGDGAHRMTLHHQPMRHSMASRRPALTLLELVIVLVIIGLISIIAVRELGHYLDRLAVRTAVAEAAEVVSRARDEALARHALVSVRIDTSRGTLSLRARGQPLAMHALGHALGVSLSTTRDSLAFDVRGLGYGASNLTLVARRGRAAETLVVSRLGRTRLSR
jgi:type II secretory pathway pseudopilin PulG